MSWILVLVTFALECWHPGKSGNVRKSIRVGCTVWRLHNWRAKIYSTIFSATASPSLIASYQGFSQSCACTRLIWEKVLSSEFRPRKRWLIVVWYIVKIYTTTLWCWIWVKFRWLITTPRVSPGVKSPQGDQASRGGHESNFDYIQHPL